MVGITLLLHTHATCCSQGSNNRRLQELRRLLARHHCLAGQPRKNRGIGL